MYICKYANSYIEYKIVGITIKITKGEECYYYSRVRARNKF